MMSKNLIFILLAIFYSLQGIAQNQRAIDSLNNILSHSKTDTIKVKALNQLCWQYKNVDPDKAIEYGKQGLKLAEKIQFKEGIANSNNNIGVAYKIKSDLPTSLKYHLKALEHREAINDKRGIGISLNNIGNVYYSLKNLKEALVYYERSLKVRTETNDEYGMAGNLSNIGGIYIELNNLPLAEKYYLRALTLFEKIKDMSGQSVVLNNLSNVYEDLGQLDKALKYMKEALNKHVEMGDKVGESVGYLNIGGLLIKQKNYTEAIDNLNKALTLTRETGDSETMWYVYFNLAQAHEEKGDPTSALKYFKNYAEVKDTMLNAESSRQISEMQTKYETEKKEKEIKLLTQQREIQALELAKRKAERNILIGLVLFLILTVALLYNRARLKRLAIENENKLRQEQGRIVAMINGQEAERKRISEELHDGIGQLLSAVKLNVEALSPKVPESDKGGFSTALKLIDESCREVRTISHNLMPGILTKAGLIPAVQEFAASINTAGKVKIIIENDSTPRLEPEKEVNLFRIIQELVNNALKYADAAIITIQLNGSEKGLTVMVEDDGKGFDTVKLQTSPGNGWNNINSRLRILNGVIEVDSALNRGTVVFIDIPLEVKNAA